MAGGAHKRSFHDELAVDDTFREKFQQPFELVVRSVALALEAKYSALMLRVNELAAMPDAGKALKLFEAEIPGAPALQWHFFQTIDTPRWLRPLLRSRFTVAPQLELPESGQGLRSRQWPIAAYLRRMATADDPDARAIVAEAIRKVAGSQNPDIREQGIDIIAALPVADAACLVDVLEGWLALGLQHGYFEKPVQLLKAFAQVGYKDPAFKLARAIFRVVDEDGSLATLHAQNMYEHYLPQAVSALGNLDSRASVEFFSVLLMEAAHISGKLREGDWTEYTPESLADDRMASYDVYDALIIAVRNAAYLLMEKAPTEISNVISYVYGRGPRIFKQIALQVLSRCAPQAPSLAAEFLSDKELIGESWCEEEYAELAKAWFAHLTESQQAIIFDLIDTMPDKYHWWPSQFEEHHGKPPDANDMRLFRQSVIRDATWKWREALPALRRQALDAIVEEIGDPDAWRNTILRPSVSPMSGDDFVSRSLPEIVNFLQTWRPRAEPVRQTIAALGQQLRTAAEHNPDKFLACTSALISLRPIYIRRILEGLSTAARNQIAAKWNKALELIESTIGHLNERVEPSELSEDDDKDWHWAATAATDLLKTMLRRDDGALTNDQAPQIIAIIEVLARLAPKSPKKQSFEDEFRKHPSFTAEQTLRGSVSDLCVLFLYWGAQRDGAPLASVPRTAMEHFDQIRSILDVELADTSSDGQIPRAVLGRYLRNIFYFGEDWLRSRMQQLFPADNPFLRGAAWSGHLLNDAGPLAPVMIDLEQSYKEEIANLSREDSGDESVNRTNRLSEYIVILFVYEAASLDLVQRFWAAAPDRVRQHAMWFLGKLMASNNLEQDALIRARSYWDMRISAGEVASDKSLFRKELGAIGQWLVSGSIDEEWYANQLLRAVRAGFAPASAYSVIEWLGKRAPCNSDRAVETVAALISIPNLDPWVYITYRDSMRAILAQGREKGTAATVNRVNETISRLASFGEAGYLDLLTPSAQ